MRIDQQLFEGEEIGEDPERDQEIIRGTVDAVLERSATFARTTDGANLSAALLVAGKQALDDIGSITDQQHTIGEQSALLMSALDDSDFSEVRQGFTESFRVPDPTTSESGESSSNDLGARVDAASHPHVATAQAQHNAAVRGPPPPPPGVAGVAAAAAQNLAQQQMAQPAPPPRRTGSLFSGPQPVARAENVAILTQNLEDHPLVADLVQRGLLKTADVMSKTYVQAMEKKLREQKLTKEVEGRDPRYRTARAAYHPPVNVVTTATPGVYRYQRPRFAR